MNIFGKNKLEIQGYIFEKELGKGQFGNVYYALKKSDPRKKFAIKEINKQKFISIPKLKELFECELYIMKASNHQNVLKMYDSFETDQDYYLVLKLCNEGDLTGYITKKYQNNIVPEFEAVFYLKQILSGFQELHKISIMHRDFKMDNLLVDNDKGAIDIIIGDFGFAKQGDIGKTYLGTPMTMAPEIMMNASQYDSKVDIWSLGIVFYQMLFGDLPFASYGRNGIERIKQKSGENLDFSKKKISEKAQDLLKKMLQVDPKKRIDWLDIFQHKIFEMNHFDFEGSGKCPIIKNLDEVDCRFKNSKKFYEKKVPLIEKPIIHPMALESKIVPVKNAREQDMILLKNFNIYYHQIQITEFIMITVKTLNNLAKLDVVSNYEKEILQLSYILNQIAICMLDFLQNMITKKSNYFNLKQFEFFLNHEFYVKRVINHIDEYYQPFQKYKQHLIKKLEQRHPESKKFMNKIQGNAFQLIRLLQEECDHDIFSRLLSNKKIKKKCTRLINYLNVSVVYILNMDTLMQPYQVHQLFDFKTFYEELDKKSAEELYEFAELLIMQAQKQQFCEQYLRKSATAKNLP